MKTLRVFNQDCRGRTILAIPGSRMMKSTAGFPIVGPVEPNFPLWN